MSRTIDEKVVSMEFDNKNFEQNVKTTMGTLDNLKKKLDFSNDSQVLNGLKGINYAAKQVDLSSLTNSIETIRLKFSALEVAGVTALMNITNQAMKTGTSMLKALTIQPITTGFQEYETQIGSIQTILANTESKGTTLEEVNNALDELNKYADMTIYNFTQMTRNIGTFTAAGVDLDKAVTSIKGIANLAAVSGSTSQQASTAMYQLSQALAAGRVSLMDWNSVVNAGMGGQVFQNALKRTATVMGTNVDALIEKYGSFRESLTQGQWLTAEVLTETLTQLSGAYTEADLIAKGYTEEQAKDIVDLADTAVNAATKVKTWTQLWDTLREAAQSGWTQTWEILVGDFEEAKELFTGISDFVSGLLNTMSDARNKLLAGAFTSSWKQLTQQINDAGVSTTDFENKVSELARQNGYDVDALIEEFGSLGKAVNKSAIPIDIVREALRQMGGVSEGAADQTENLTEKLEYFQKVVDQVWRGDYKNGQERVEALTAAGYNYAEVQNLVNKTVDGHRLTLEDLNVETLTAIGYTEEEANALRELALQAEEAGTPIDTLLNNLTRMSGRELVIESFKNALQPIGAILSSIGTAWRSAFPAMQSEQLYGALNAIYEFSKGLVISKDTISDITDTLKGFFAIVDMVVSIFGGGFKIAFEVFSRVAVNLANAMGFGASNILDITAALGRAISGFRDWLEQMDLIGKAADFISNAIINFAKGIKDAVTASAGFSTISNVFSGIERVFYRISTAINRFVTELKQLGDNVTLEGFANAFNNAVASFKTGINLDLYNIFGRSGIDIFRGLISGLSKGVVDVVSFMVDTAKKMYVAFCNFFGIDSPSKLMIGVGGFIILGLLTGLTQMFPQVGDFFKDMGNTILGFIQNIPWASIITALVSVGTVGVINKLIPLIQTLLTPLTKLSSVFDALSGTIKGVGKSMVDLNKSKAFNFKTEGIKNLAIAVGILVASLVALTLIDQNKIWPAIGAVAALAAVVGVLAIAVSKFSGSQSGDGGMKDTIKSTLNVVKLSTFLIALSGLLVMFAVVVALIGAIGWEKAAVGVGSIVALLVAFGVLIKMYGKLGESNTKNISKVGTMLLKLSVSLLLMSAVIAIMGNLSEDTLIQGGIAIAAFIGVIYVLAQIATKGKAVEELGKTLKNMATSMLIMVAVIAIIGLMDPEIIKKGLATIGSFIVMITFLTLITKLSGANFKGLGSTLLAMSSTMLIMAGVIAIAGSMSIGQIGRGILAITAFVALMGVFLIVVKALNAVQGDMPKIGVTLLSFSAAIGILALVAIMLSLIDIIGLGKGIVAVGVLGILIKSMIKATKGASDIKGTMMGLAATIGVLAGSLIILSFIDVGRLIKATAALWVVMGSLASVLKAAGTISGGKNSLLGFAGVAATLVIAVGALMLLSYMDLESVLASSISLGILMISMSTVLKATGKMVGIGTNAVVALGVLGVVMAMLAGILMLMQNLPIESTLINAASLSTLLISMSVVTLILSKIGTGVTGAINGAISLVSVIGIIGTVMAAIGGLVTLFPGLEAFVSRGIDLLNQVASGIGQFLGNLIGGVAEGITDALPGIGTNLSLFMENLTPFLEGMSGVDPAAVDMFSELVGGIASLAGSNVLDSLVQFFGGEGSLENFGSQLTDFGEGLKGFADAVSGIDNVDGALKAAEIGKALSEVAATIPAEGGLFQMFTGTKNLQQFGTDLEEFGNSLVGYSKSVSGIQDVNAVTEATEAAKSLAEMAEAIPNSGGLFGWFAGNNDIDDFGTKLASFGNSLYNYYNAVKGITDTSSITASVEASKAIIEMSKGVQNSGGVIGWFVGENNLDEFGTRLETYGTSLMIFARTALVTDTSGVESMVSASNSVISMINSMAGMDASGVDPFTQAIQKLSSLDLTEFGANFSAVADKFVSVGVSIIDNMNAGLTAGIPLLLINLTSIMFRAVEHIQSLYPNIYAAGTGLIENFRLGINDEVKQLMLTVAVSLTITRMLTTINSYKDRFYNAGSNMVQGFCNGITANIWKAEAEARAMAQAALNAANAALGVASPSKEFYKTGTYVGMGLANAMREYGTKVYSAGEQMANNATNGLRNALSNISAIISNDIDTQPTIRPVLDISDVTNGVGVLTGLFNSINPSMQLATTAGSIGSMMSSSKDLQINAENANAQTPTQNIVNFVQNNNSPKALSRVDIYRDTKSLLSRTKSNLDRKAPK